MSVYTQPLSRSIPDVVRHLAWFAVVCVVAFLVPYLGVSVLDLQHDLFYLVYFAVTIALVATYVRVERVDVAAIFRRRWRWSLAVATVRTPSAAPSKTVRLNACEAWNPHRVWFLRSGTEQGKLPRTTFDRRPPRSAAAVEGDAPPSPSDSERNDLGDEKSATALSNETASEIIRELVSEERIMNAEVLAYQLSSLLPAGEAAVFETDAGRRRFALVLDDEEGKHIVYRAEINVRGSEDERVAAVSISRDVIIPSTSSIRMHSECVRQRKVLHRGEQTETWLRERSWTIQVPVEPGAIAFGTQEPLAQRTTRPNYKPDPKWTPVQADLDRSERFARALAKTLGWSAPSDDCGRDDMLKAIAV